MLKVHITIVNTYLLYYISEILLCSELLSGGELQLFHLLRQQPWDFCLSTATADLHVPAAAGTADLQYLLFSAAASAGLLLPAAAAPAARGRGMRLRPLRVHQEPAAAHSRDAVPLSGPAAQDPLQSPVLAR
jgi:hypothetical protein